MSQNKILNNLCIKYSNYLYNELTYVIYKEILILGWGIADPSP